MENIFALVLFMLSSFIVPALGIIGYYLDIHWLLSIAIISFGYTTVTKYFNKLTLTCHGIAIFIGLIIALIFKLDVLLTAMVAICYEWIITSLWGYVMLFFNSRKGGNFEFIAKNMALIYYVICNSEFGKSLTEDQLLYATAFCDTISYLSSGTISGEDLEDAIFISKASVVQIGFYPQGHNAFEYIPNRNLVNLTMQIEAMIFATDTNVDYHYIVDSVIANKEIISQTIEDTLKKGKRIPLYKTIYKNVSAMLDTEELQKVIKSYTGAAERS